MHVYIKISKILADALSEHEYGTSASFRMLTDISQSANLGARMMRNPTRENALACLNHAQYLIRHQNYLALAIAPAVGVALVAGTGVAAYAGWRFFNNRATITQHLPDFQTRVEEEEDDLKKAIGVN